MAGQGERKKTMLFQMAASYIPVVRGQPVNSSSSRCPIHSRSYSSKYKQVDSTYKYQKHQISQKRENIFQMPNPKWLSHFLSELNFTTLMQTWLSVECSLEIHKGLAGVPSQKAQSPPTALCP
jgi:hypothetical protein